MATYAHCLYCFDVISARVEHRKLLDLSQVESYWNRYLASEPEDDVDAGEKGAGGAAGDEGPIKDEQNESQVAEALPSHSTPVSHHATTSNPGHTPIGQKTPSGSSSSTPSLNSFPLSLRSNDSSPSTPSSISSLSSTSRAQEPPLSILMKPERYPMFVTWNTIGRSGNTRLRGCIGTFEAQELDHGLKTYALTSAFEDSRFAPIDARELPTLECGVTLLTDFETAPTPMSWEIGKHGLRISFTHHLRRYGATYLPDVAREQGWTKTETLVSLMHKAGWRGRDDDWHKVGDLSVVRYQGSRVTAQYEDWRTWKDWVMEQQG